MEISKQLSFFGWNKFVHKENDVITLKADTISLQPIEMLLVNIRKRAIKDIHAAKCVNSSGAFASIYGRNPKTVSQYYFFFGGKRLRVIVSQSGIVYSLQTRFSPNIRINYPHILFKMEYYHIRHIPSMHLNDNNYGRYALSDCLLNCPDHLKIFGGHFVDFQGSKSTEIWCLLLPSTGRSRNEWTA